LQPDGKILIGGSFSSVLGLTRNNIARLNRDGTLDTSFDPDAHGVVLSIAVQVDGKILVGGSFDSIGGQPRNRLSAHVRAWIDDALALVVCLVDVPAKILDRGGARPSWAACGGGRHGAT
jgi:hypothetical protein